jgi:hypothetical protein
MFLKQFGADVRVWSTRMNIVVRKARGKVDRVSSVSLIAFGGRCRFRPAGLESAPANLPCSFLLHFERIHHIIMPTKPLSSLLTTGAPGC